MRRTSVVAALGLALLGVPASANDATTITGVATWAGSGDGTAWTSECRLVGVAQENATGDRELFTGVLVGAAVAYHPSTSTPAFIDVQCMLVIDGTLVAEADDAGSTGVDTASRQVTFSATDTQDVDVCVAVGIHTGGPVCGPTSRAQVPPQAVRDLVDTVRQLVPNPLGPLDPVICPVLASLSPGAPGAVDIDIDGDVTVLGQQVHDCPPYGS